MQIFGGLVWILVACTLVEPANPQGWVMFVSIFCFVMTFIWMVAFACGAHQHHHSSWATAVSSVCVCVCERTSACLSESLAVLQDFLYHTLAALFYLSASVSLAKVTLDLKDGSFQNYQLDISAVVSPARPGTSRCVSV